MSLLTQQGDALIHTDAYALEQRLWDFDPRLQLRYRVVTRGDGVKGRRYEVWRHNEDGSNTMVGHWRLDEFDKIETDLAIMRAGAEGRTDSVLDRIDANNEAVDAANAREFRDAYGAMADHKLSLVRDEGHKTRFGYRAGS